MELHSCHNCQLIDEVISTKLQNFDILTEENLTLHQILMKERDSVLPLQAEILHLSSIIAAERQRNLDLYLKQLNEQNNSNVLMNVVLKANSKNADNQFSYTKKVSFQHPSPSTQQQTVPADKYESLMGLYEEQTKVYEDNLETIQACSEKYIRKLETELEKARDHSSIILEMYSLYRKQLFSQKLENARDRKDFLDTTDILSKVNKKHMVEVERQLMETTTCAVTEQTRGTFNSLMQQIHKRDKLVHMLRRQHAVFDKEIPKLEKEVIFGREKSAKIIDDLKKQLQNEKRKYIALEKRRAFDLEGFQTDIQQLRNKLAKLKKIPNRTELQDEFDDIEERLNTTYVK